MDGHVGGTGWQGVLSSEFLDSGAAPKIYTFTCTSTAPEQMVQVNTNQFKVVKQDAGISASCRLSVVVCNKHRHRHIDTQICTETHLKYRTKPSLV